MKKLFCALLILVFLLSAATPVFAEDGKVTYSGNSGDFIFEPGGLHSPTDLFPNFKDVIPGDQLTQKIVVKNKANKKIKVKIYMRALGAHEDSEEFLSKLNLTVQKSAKNEMPYMFDATADQTAQLTDWVCIGTLYSGGTVSLDVTLSVPTELENNFQNEIGYLDWEFKVEERPLEPGDPKPPATGDATHIKLWIALIPLTLAAMFILLIFRKKNGEKENATAQ